ncbi:TPA: DUF5358 family protein [Mannheimia haemolytica]
MLKKTVTVALYCCTTFCATAFANNLENSTASTLPKYQISDMDMKILIRQLNNIEQCIYPDLAKPDYKKIYENWSVAENMTMHYFERQILQELLGQKNFTLMQEDKASMDYFNLLHKKLNHQQANVDKERCDAFKSTYQEIYQRVQNTLPKVYK